MSPHNKKLEFLLGIIFVSVYFYLYCASYLAKYDSESTSFSQFSDTHQSKPNKTTNGSTVNIPSEMKVLTNLTEVNTSTSEKKNLSTMAEIPFPSASASIIPQRLKLTVEERNRIMKLINISNAEQKIYNAEIFGPLTNETFVMAIQVHFRFEYLELLLQSLATAQGINDSIIIFSHDIYSPEMNAVIQKINFARVLQIFFPYSHQTNPELYPGKATESGSGTSRSSSFQKLHLWWKTHFLFNEVNVLKKHEGVIHFLEEDIYVIPDYIPVMNKMEVLMRENYCFGCNVLIAGHVLYTESITKSWKNGTHNVAIVTDLDDPTVNRGLAFNRTLWKKIAACEKVYCDTYREANWDYALEEISMSCMNTSRLTVLAPEAPRLFHVGVCGMHYKAKVCNPLPVIDVIKKYIRQFYSVLFPPTINLLSIEFIKKKGRRRPAGRSGGDWSRSDSKLCRSFGVNGQMTSVSSSFNNSNV